VRQADGGVRDHGAADFANPPESRTFRRTGLQAGGAAIGALFAIVGVSMALSHASTGDVAFGAVLIAGSAVFIWRSIRAGTLILERHALRVIGLLGSKRIPVEEIDRVYSEERRVGAGGWKRSCLAVRLTNGRDESLHRVQQPPA
jgi:hypothetical protein